MYWFLSGRPESPGWILLAWAGWAIGGWLLTRSLFRLEARERLVAGAGVGLGAYIFLSNLLAQWLGPQAGFVLAGALILAGGGIAHLRSPGGPLGHDLAGWKLVAATGVAVVFFTLMGRGLAILDDRKNLALISLMAAGDVPPHFYMNPSTLFRYHYGFQLLGASAVRLGGLFPWSAFDLTKGIVASLSLAVGYLIGVRWSHRVAGGWIAVGSLLLAGGARWALLAAPPAFLTAAGSGIELWGSAEASASSLTGALLGTWTVAGGPVIPIPFAYLSGVLEPFVLGLHAGPGSLSRLFLFLLPLLLPRARNVTSVLVVAVVLAAWALGFEALFGLFALGVLAWALWVRAWRRGAPGGDRLRWTVAAVLIGGLLGMVQGGTLTEMLHAVVRGGETGVAGGVPLVSLRWPPAIVSSHLGELRLADPKAMVVALAELGAPLAAGALVLARAFRRARRGRFDVGILALGSLAGFLIPIFMRYWPDRDVTRFSAYAELVWIVAVIPLILQALRRWRGPTPRGATLAYLAVLNFSGVVVLGSLLTALPRGVLTEKMAPIDGAMARQMWDRLPAEAIVFDSHPWRSVVLTGRPSKSTDLEYQPLPEWEALVDAPTPGSLARAGFTHVYADEHWLRGLSEASRSAMAESCVRALWSAEDNADNGTRQLLDITGCEQAK